MITGASGAKILGVAACKSQDMSSVGRNLEYGGGGEDGTDSDIRDEDDEWWSIKGGAGRGRRLVGS